jgi:predicted aspartyl protease
MGRVTVAVRIENIHDSLEARAGRLSPDRVRAIAVDDALVDTGARLLSLPKRMIDQLGLQWFDTRPARTSAGTVQTRIHSAVWLTILGRQCTVDVAEVPDDCPVLVGHFPLEILDLIVDPANERLIPNPKDGGQRVLDLF